VSDEVRQVVEALQRGPDGRSTRIPSGQGAPAWLARMTRHCARCGGALAEGLVDGEDRERLWCPDCGQVAYLNPRLVVTTFPMPADDRVILLRRGIEPGLGSWAQPGGFLEIDETVTEAAIRETFEETGLVVEPGTIVGLYSRLEAGVVVIALEARIVGGEAHVTTEALEVREFGTDDLPWEGIAFTTTTWALRDWVTRRGVAPPPLDGPGSRSARSPL
jgi:ADP-ribose pyrophosphatase YjhB (NUDIX family)